MNNSTTIKPWAKARWNKEVFSGHWRPSAECFWFACDVRGASLAWLGHPKQT